MRYCSALAQRPSIRTAYETLGRLIDTRAIAKNYRTVMQNYRNGINKGLYKIMSKMGISTIASYRCSKLFEAVGLHDDVVNLCFGRGQPYRRREL